MSRNPNYHKGAAEQAGKQGDWLTAIQCWAKAIHYAGANLRGRLVQESAKAHEHAAAQWNERYAAGHAVLFWTGARDGEGRRGRTVGAAYLLGTTAMIRIEGCPGGVALTHVDPLPSNAPGKEAACPAP